MTTTSVLLDFREAAKQALAAGNAPSVLIKIITDLDAPDSLGERLSDTEVAEPV